MPPREDRPEQPPEFERHSPEEEFRTYVDNELNRLRTSDVGFDEDLYQRAVELVLQRLRRR